MASRPVVIIYAPTEPVDKDLTAIGLAVGMGFYALIGAGLAALSLAQTYGWM